LQKKKTQKFAAGACGGRWILWRAYLFCVLVGLFCVLVGLFCVIVSLFCVIVGLGGEYYGGLMSNGTASIGKRLHA